IEKIAKDILKNITKKAESWQASNIREAKTYDELKKILSTYRGFARASFCSVEKDGLACADKVQAETEGGKVRGTLFDKAEKPSGKCIVCGRPARAVVYVAKSY
ncbi:MAG: hypothetical protein HY438_02900, partial [DPANN group archaeon]|nr:hypothetical protein [DPANN group archaeon]